MLIPGLPPQPAETRATQAGRSRRLGLGVALPNLITLARLLSAPVGVWLLVNEAYSVAFWLFLGAGLSDALDGYLAKRFDSRTEFGAYLDAIADKLLLVSIFVTAGWQGHLPQWAVILTVFRDVMIVGGCVLIPIAGGNLDIRPSWSGKATTAAQIALAVALMARLGLGLGAPPLEQALVWLVAAASVWSGAGYIAVGLRLVNGAPLPGKDRR